MNEWNPLTKHLPQVDMEAFDVTIEHPDGIRSLNVAIFRTSNQTWELMIDKYHFNDCKVIAWKERTDYYRQ